MSNERDAVTSASMRQDHAALVSRPGLLAIASIVMLCVLTGCGRDHVRPAGSAASSAADIDSAPGAGGGGVQQSDFGAANPPTPGFTSQQGTPPARPAVPVAPADMAARVAPPPPASLVALVNEEERAATARLPAGAGRELVLGSCLICHAVTMIEQQHKSAAAWEKTVTQMIAWGAPVPAGKQSVVVAYLAEHYPARATGASLP